jgi:O-antigen ligase
MTAAAGTGAGRVLRAAGSALPAGLGLSAATGAIALIVHPDGWTVLTAIAGAALAALAWLRPVLAVGLLLALSPICGHRPTTGPFVAFVALTACAVPGWLARLWTRDRAAALDVLGTPAGLALTAYVGASVLSLSSLPLYAPADIVEAATLGEAIRLLPGALAAADVTAVIYPVLTVVLTLHAAVAALTVAVALRVEAERPPASGQADAALLVTGGILAGLVLTIAAGALDRLGYLDLRVLRATDPFTNLSGADRLQSTFGHAGWFAEYICFATPAILALWLWPPDTDARPGTADAAGRDPRGRLVGRLSTAAGLLLIALVAIVLSYQRGGWITWALVAAGIVAAIVRLAAPVPGPDGATWPPRRLAAIGAATVILAIGSGLLVVRVAGGPGAMDRFAARARTITQVSDRQAHVTAGLRLGSLLPILGGGSESFAMRYEQQYLRGGGAFYARGYSPLLNMYGSAHNVFAQTFAGKGAIGLIALVLVVLTSAAAAVRTLRRPDAPPRARVIAMVAFGMVAAFAIYGQVQEVFYVAPLQLTVFAAFGLAASLEPPLGSAERSRRRLGIVAALLAAGLAAHAVHAYVVPGRLADEYRDREISRAGERLSAPVLDAEGQYFQWTGARAVITVPRQATELSFDVRQPDTAPRDVEVRFDGRTIDRVRLEDGSWRHLVYPLDRVKTLPRRLEIVVLPGGGGAASDRRLAVRRIRWGLPEVR